MMIQDAATRIFIYLWCCIEYEYEYELVLVFEDADFLHSEYERSIIHSKPYNIISKYHGVCPKYSAIHLFYCRKEQG